MRAVLTYLYALFLLILALQVPEGEGEGEGLGLQFKVVVFMICNLWSYLGPGEGAGESATYPAVQPFFV